MTSPDVGELADGTSSVRVQSMGRNLVLQGQVPELRSWLVLLDMVFEEINNPVWNCCIPVVGDLQRMALPPYRLPERLVSEGGELGQEPILYRRVFCVEPQLLNEWIRRLFEATRDKKLISFACSGHLDSFEVMEASLEQDGARLWALARRAGVRPSTFVPIAVLAAMPLLKACKVNAAPWIPDGWSNGYCPVCGAYPALSEPRPDVGVKQVFCYRCGADWPYRQNRCMFCKNDDSETLCILVSHTRIGTHRIDACMKCSRYTKSIFSKGTISADQVALEDAVSVELDLIALESGFSRPDGLGHPLGICLVAASKWGLVQYQA